MNSVKDKMNSEIYLLLIIYNFIAIIYVISQLCQVFE